MRLLRLLDYAVALACLGYGLATSNEWLAGGGVLGLGLAYLNLGARVGAKIKSRAKPAAPTLTPVESAEQGTPSQPPAAPSALQVEGVPGYSGALRKNLSLY